MTCKRYFTSTSAVLFALFWKRSNRQGILAGLVAGGVMVFVWKFGIAKLGDRFKLTFSVRSSVNREKQRRLFRAASAYVKRHNIDKEVIFDIVAITYEEDSHYIEYHKGGLIVNKNSGKPHSLWGFPSFFTSESRF